MSENAMKKKKKEGCEPSTAALRSDSDACVRETNDVMVGIDTAGRETINEYTILRQIGQGSQATVCVCSKLHRHRGTIRYLAIKMFDTHVLRKTRRWKLVEGSDSPVVLTALGKLHTEIALMKKMRHPNVVRLHEVINDRAAERLYMVMEWVEQGQVMRWSRARRGYRHMPMTHAPVTEHPVVSRRHTSPEGWAAGGETFSAQPPSSNETGKPKISRAAPRTSRGVSDLIGLPVHLRRKYFRDIVDGVTYLHAQHIVHRDLKPENVLVSSDDVCKIADFGVAHFFDPVQHSDDTAQHSLSGTEGTYHFMAPECCDGRQSFSGYTADIWSLGVILYVFAFGSVPFWADTELDLFHLIAQGRVAIPPASKPQRDTAGQSRAKVPNDAAPESTDDPLLLDLLRRLLEKDPTRRISLDRVRGHAWLTESGKRPMPSLALNKALHVSADEVAHAVSTRRSRSKEDLSTNCGEFQHAPPHHRSCCCVCTCM